MKNQNPFPLYDYINSKYFCDRVTETERILSAVTNQRNIILVSENGIGKTTLIKHVAKELKELDNYRFVYVSLLKTESPGQFLNTLLESVFYNGKLQKEIKNILPDLSNIKNTNPSKSSKQIIVPENIDFGVTLEKIFSFLEKKTKKIVLAIDEFQNITNWLSENDIKSLQSVLAQSQNVSFILSSNKLGIFKTISEENISKTEIIELQKIERKKYFNFIKKRFTKEKIKIDKKSIEYILTWSKTNTFYTHYICNKIYNEGHKKINVNVVKTTIKNILKEYEYIFLGYKSLLSNYQWKLLAAIAKAGDEAKITSIKFIEQYQLNAPSSVKTGINALIEKGLVVRKQRSYHLTNVFLEQWIERFYN